MVEGEGVAEKLGGGASVDVDSLLELAERLNLKRRRRGEEEERRGEEEEEEEEEEEGYQIKVG